MIGAFAPSPYRFQTPGGSELGHFQPTRAGRVGSPALEAPSKWAPLTVAELRSALAQQAVLPRPSTAPARTSRTPWHAGGRSAGGSGSLLTMRRAGEQRGGQRPASGARGLTRSLSLRRPLSQQHSQRQRQQPQMRPKQRRSPTGAKQSLFGRSPPSDHRPNAQARANIRDFEGTPTLARYLALAEQQREGAVGRGGGSDRCVRKRAGGVFVSDRPGRVRPTSSSPRKQPPPPCSASPVRHTQGHAPLMTVQGISPTARQRSTPVNSPVPATPATVPRADTNT